MHSNTIIFLFQVTKGSDVSIEIPVRLVNNAGKILKSSDSVVPFTGKETFDETFAKAQETFPDKDVLSIKLGRLHGEAMANRRSSACHNSAFEMNNVRQLSLDSVLSFVLLLVHSL